MRLSTTTSRLRVNRSGCSLRSALEDGHAHREHNGRCNCSVQAPVPTLPDATGEDYLFFPHYENRATAARAMARQFNALLEETGLKMIWHANRGML